MTISPSASVVSFLFAGLAAAGLCACGGPTDTAGPAGAPSPATTGGDAGDPVKGGWLVEVVSAEPAHLNALLATSDGTSRYIGRFIFETLLKINLDTLEMEPYVAESWEVSDDHLTYTFHLRDDVTFSDGEPLTSEDVKFTYDLIMDPANDTAPLRNYMLDVESVETPDPHTVIFKMSKPYYANLMVVSDFEIYPKHIYEGEPLNNHPNARKPVGSGPYVFENWDTGQEIVIARNDNYWGETPLLDKRVYRFILEDNAAFQVLERHEIDMMEVPPQIWTTRANTPRFEAEFHKLVPDSPVPGYLSRYNYIGWNMRKPQFEDKRVRRALALLFDTDLIIETVWSGLGTPISGSAFHKGPDYNPEVKPVGFDPERAAELLTEAGWVDADKDGIREKDGVPFKFELGFAAGVSEYLQLGNVYQDELRRAGIDVSLNPMEWATFQERLHKRSFDAAMLAWLTVPVSDPYQLFHSSQAENGSNYPGLKNDEIDRIIEEARVTFDDEERNKLYHRYHEILADEQPYNFLYSRPGLIAVDNRFQDTIVHKGGIDPLEWWVPAQNQRYP